MKATRPSCLHPSSVITLWLLRVGSVAALLLHYVGDGDCLFFLLTLKLERHLT
jgi:hypothetical protein